VQFQPLFPALLYHFIVGIPSFLAFFTKPYIGISSATRNNIDTSS